jgi:hypothetical protein
LQAFKTFSANMPADTGIVTHIDEREDHVPMQPTHVQTDEALRWQRFEDTTFSTDRSFDRIAAIAADLFSVLRLVLRCRLSRAPRTRITLVWLGVANGNQALSSAKSVLNHLILWPRLRRSNAGRGIPTRANQQSAGW